MVAALMMAPQFARADMSLRGDMLGSVRSYRTAYDDTLLNLARKNGLGYVEIIAAN